MKGPLMASRRKFNEALLCSLNEEDIWTASSIRGNLLAIAVDSCFSFIWESQKTGNQTNK